ncbi:hypothetical protein J2S74_000092 [Evansella vedderi]|uniref:DUF3231 family protein n=1 Tax=Evansella vedderi TaxID=38282 RepID=A0ABT9ZNB4_9BACI|nr:DUF3231 family protein [Evansella vedderi]MDQ0252720.1 hypothetical protein [Evansella vedderi]
MTSPIEAITNVLKTFVDEEPKPALHVGEVMDLWATMTAFHEAQALYQIGLNMTVDTDLKHALEKALQGSTADTQRILTFMKDEGIPIPTSQGEKTKSNPNEVPEGVRLTDEEIANLISVKVASSITFCAQAMSQTIRSDVGILFIQMMVNLMNYAASLKSLMKSRGWLKEPPRYHPPGSPSNNK